MTYLLYDIKFYKIGENGEPLKDEDGNIKLFKPHGRWKELEHLSDDRTDEEFEKI